MPVHVLTAKEYKKTGAEISYRYLRYAFFLLSGGGCGEGSHCILVSSLVALAWQYQKVIQKRCSLSPALWLNKANNMRMWSTPAAYLGHRPPAKPPNLSWFKPRGQQSTTRLLAHSSPPGGMGRRKYNERLMSRDKDREGSLTNYGQGKTDWTWGKKRINLICY